ncbi:MAG: hypothetical protein AB8B87_27435 [Granulosicoccus sp.]
MAQYFTEGANDEVIGQVAVFGEQDYSLLALCKEFGGVSVKVDLPYYDDSGFATGEHWFAFGSEPWATYKISFDDNFSIVVAEAKLFFANLMNDMVSMKVQKISENISPEESIQFVVKNFPTAWKVACGWHAEYNASTGIT